MNLSKASQKEKVLETGSNPLKGSELVHESGNTMHHPLVSFNNMSVKATRLKTPIENSQKQLGSRREVDRDQEFFGGISSFYNLRLFLLRLAVKQKGRAVFDLSRTNNATKRPILKEGGRVLRDAGCP